MLHMSWNSEEKKFNETKSNKLLNLKMWEISFSIDWSDQINSKQYRATINNTKKN